MATKRVSSQEMNNAFRETFLLAMPPERRRVFREYGETMFEYGLEMNRYSAETGVSYLRGHLAAVLFDLEYLELYLRENIDPEEVGGRGEAKLAEIAEEQRQLLEEIIGRFRKALGRRGGC